MAPLFDCSAAIAAKLARCWRAAAEQHTRTILQGPGHRMLLDELLMSSRRFPKALTGEARDAYLRSLNA